MNSGPTLSIGSTGPDVRRLQVLFVMMQYLEYSDIDGNFGSKTQERVKDFQQDKSLTPDGSRRTINVGEAPCGSEHSETSARGNWRGRVCFANGLAEI